MAGKDDVKEKIDIVNLIGETVTLKRAGRNFKGLCPFHDEKTPSFFVSPERQMYKCFGCGESGDIYSFFMHREGITFPEALKDLAQKAGIELTDFKPSQDYQLKQQLIEINLAAAKLYHFLLTQHKIGQKALQYLMDRGVTKTQIKDFQLGYAPNSWRTLSDFLQKKNFKTYDIESTGLAISGSHGFYDRFRGRVIFPLFDHRNNLVGFSGRLLPWTDDGKSGKYINTPETILYHKSKMLYPLYHIKESIRQKNNVIVIEGELDVLSSIRVNVTNIVAVKGSALTDDQVRLLHRFCDTIILALDADQAGIKAAKRAIEVASAADMNIKVVELSGGKDPDELIKTDPKLWKQAIKQAVGIYDFFIDVAVRENNLQTSQGKQAVSDQIIPILIKIENKVVQDHYVKKLAQVLNTQATVIESEMNRLAKKAQIDRPNISQTAAKKTQEKSRLDKLLTKLLNLVLHHFLQVDLSQIILEDLPISATQKILQKLITQKPKDIIKFSKSLDPELQSQFDDSFLLETEELETDKVNAKIEQILGSIAKIWLRDRLGKLRSELNQADNNSREEIKHQVNETLVRLRRYN
jgi:DNA primase